MSEKLFKLPKELAEKWILALKSGEYAQDKKNLKTSNGYCCLGVLGCILNTDQEKMYMNSDMKIGNIIQNLPEDLNWITLAESKELVRSLALINDESNDFVEVIKYIETNCEFI